MLEAALLLLEAHFGSQLKQNYLAIMTGSVFTGTKRWMGIVFLLKLLPIALSVSYKQSIGGSASRTWQPDIPSKGDGAGMYGIDFPVISDWSPPNDCL